GCVFDFRLVVVLVVFFVFVLYDFVSWFLNHRVGGGAVVVGIDVWFLGRRGRTGLLFGGERIARLFLGRRGSGLGFAGHGGDRLLLNGTRRRRRALGDHAGVFIAGLEDGAAFR